MKHLSPLCRMSACRFCCPNGDILCRVSDMSQHVAGHVATRRWSCRRHKKMSCRLECLNNTIFDDMSGDSRHVGNFLIVVWAQTQKLYDARVLVRLGWFVLVGCNWYKLGMSGPLLCRNDTRCQPRFGDIWRCRRHVGDTSATRRRHSGLRLKHLIYK